MGAYKRSHVVLASGVGLLALVVLLKQREPFQVSPTPRGTPRQTPRGTPRQTPLATPRQTPLATPRQTPLATHGVKRHCDATNEWRPVQTHQEFRVIKTLSEKAAQFVSHLQARYPTDERAQKLVRTWNGRVNMSTRDTGATFYPNGCMIINPYHETRRAATEPKKAAEVAQLNTPGTVPGMDDLGRLLTRMLHEFAHSTSSAHNAKFYDTQRWFLRIASEELGWPLVANCRVCCHSTTPCAEACPSCFWVEPPETCTAKCKHK